jgi:hypothetical protein
VAVIIGGSPVVADLFADSAPGEKSGRPAGRIGAASRHRMLRLQIGLAAGSAII